ncbi:hypothetical protein FOC4_g10004613 [Fusarium odoratissimum]|uniref:Uncharacterized protein n=1 Tax=Fusarium oxysporum f. sp. cubense (strain race 4) TaxID=2502994 RepID=N1S965_FUSC4|nr:hypothetical protein FOC4_g10004613 [Fusarium odoratissimum]
MSTRQLRKLQKQRELEETQILAEMSSGESDEENEPVAPKPRVSLFAALGGDDDDEAQDEDEVEQQQPEEDVTEVKQPSTSGKSKKKKNKKKKSKAKAAAPEEDEDEIDKAMRELNIKTSTPANTSTSENTAAQTRRINELLSINPYHLKANNEMRSLFGRDVIESAAAEEEQERNRRPMQREVDLETFLRGPPGAPKLPEVSLRRNVFIQGREHWPKQSAGGLTMKEVAKAEDGSFTEYAYVHEQSYDAPCTMAYAAVAYNKSRSFFDNISSESRERTENGGQKPGGREWRGEEQRKNMETFGQGSVDGAYRNYRGRGRGRGRGGRGYGRGGRGGNRPQYQTTPAQQ